MSANWTVLERLSVSHNALVAADVAALLRPPAYARLPREGAAAAGTGAGEGERGHGGGGGKDLVAVPVGGCGGAALTALDVGGNLLGDAGATALAGLLELLPRQDWLSWGSYIYLHIYIIYIYIYIYICIYIYIYICKYITIYAHT